MLTRLFADNFRCLVNFEWTLTPEVLALGANGSGKSSALDAIRLVQAWASGWQLPKDLSPSRQLTKWQNRSTMAFEVGVQCRGLQLDYRIEFDCSPDVDKYRVQEERLTEGSRVLLERDREEVRLYKDNGEQGGKFPLNWGQSAVAAVAPAPVNKKLQAFRDYMCNVRVLRPLPSLFEEESPGEAALPELALWNYTSWYRSLTSNQKLVAMLRDLLKDLWTDFDYLNLETIGRDSKAIELVFEQRPAEHDMVRLSLGSLSDGERMLLALYTLAAYQQTQAESTLVIDEPDNYISLSEIQPWLIQMLDDRPDDAQLIVVSHSPEVIEALGETRAAWFSRTNHVSATRVGAIPADDTGLSLSERIARGWVDA